jgi:hypothetical protein
MAHRPLKASSFSTSSRILPQNIQENLYTQDNLQRRTRHLKP